MLVLMHLCMPKGNALREQFSSLYNELKMDNRRVIAAMLRDGQEVPDTVGDMDLVYVPAQHMVDPETGEPVMNLYGMRAMIERGEFSCGDAAGYEAAVIEEKYRHRAICRAVPQGGDDNHAVIITRFATIDPTQNFLTGRRTPIPSQGSVNPQACTIEDGRVVCNEESTCRVDEQGNWLCPAVPGLSRRERIVQIYGQGDARWAKTSDGAVVPVVGRRAAAVRTRRRIFR